MSAPTPLRLLIVAPSWVGDSVMATPVLRAVRAALPGAFIGALVRPGIEQLLDGAGLVDEFHVEHPTGVLGPKFVAARLRPRRYDTALLLTNSFSTALVTRIAGIPRRLGYNRDARGFLLTGSIEPLRRAGGGYAPVPAVEYYWRAARELLLGARAPAVMPPMLLGLTPAQAEEGARLLAAAGVPGRGDGRPVVILNPGGNRAEKRWPAERFASVGARLASRFGARVLVNGSPGERELVESIVRAAPGAVSLPGLGVTLGSLKAACARAELMMTNDTGPRHIAAALGASVVSLFGPTDPKWTRIPVHPGAAEAELTADPTLPEDEVSDDHPERCRVDRITEERVWDAAVDLLGRRGFRQA